MSVAAELSRIQADKNTIRTKLVDLGMATGTDNLDKLAMAIEGLVNQGAVSVEIKAGNNYYIPKGYHNGGGVVSAVSNEAGEEEKYKKQPKSVTPTKQQQIVTPSDGYWGLESVTVAPIPDKYVDTTDADATAAHILFDKTAYIKGAKVEGTMPNNGNVSITIDGLTNTSVTIPEGYTSGGTVSLTGDIEEALAAI